MRVLVVSLVLLVGCGGGSGTGAHGHTFPGATLPFGMVQLSPDTRLTGWDGCSGYHWTDNVYGFSHTYLSGTGISDYGDILFMPLTGEPQLDNGHGSSPDEGYTSPFDKVRGVARDTWNRALGRIEIEGGTESQREIFYTALYHAMIAPNVYPDGDGRYRGMDGRIHRTEGRRQYPVFSLWDTFRSAHPPYTLIEP